MDVLNAFQKSFLVILGLGVLGYCASKITFEPNICFERIAHLQVSDDAPSVTDKAVLLVSEVYRRNTTEAEVFTGVSPVIGAGRSPEKDEAMLRFASRLELLRKRCPKGSENSYKRTHWVPVPHFLVDVPKRLLVCVVPKSGSSTWHGLIWSLRRMRAGLSPDQRYYSANDTIENHSAAKKLSYREGMAIGTYTADDDNLTQIPNEGTSYRMILARHPFARLISGWKDKFKTESKYSKRLFQRFPLLRGYKKTSPPMNYTISFEDFARYVAEHGRNILALDYHFKPASYLCKPCEYSYTYILKAERANEDQAWLLQRANLTDTPFVRRGVSENTLLKRNPSALIKERFSKLDRTTIEKLFLIYQKDFFFFGYTFNFGTLESGGFD